MEIWRQVFVDGSVIDRLEVSNIGQIRNKYTGRILKTSIRYGYHVVCVSLGKRGVVKLLKVHRVVAEAFIPKVDGKNVVNHIDGDKKNNMVENLEWCTPGENLSHAYRTGLKRIFRGEDKLGSKLTYEKVREIKRDYIPYSKEFGTRALGRKYGVDHSIISEIINGKLWK